jgi:chorismate lyase/3-hydroxybenzoate synthase
VGRERGLAAAGIAPAHYPAATAVGSAAPGLLVYLLAALSPGQPAENPRQVSAYRYPARYGPRPPSFARGLAWPAAGGGRFFVSGTASVVGHRSLHPGQLGPQLGETLVNLESLLQGARVGPPSFLKVFLRQPVHLAQAGEALRDWAPAGIPILYLSAQICREELEIEIEGLCGV